MTAHFAAADTLVPDAYDPLSWDRYLYVRGNSIKFNDTTGHDVGCPASNPACTKLSGYGNEDRAKAYEAYVAKFRNEYCEYLKHKGQLITSETGSDLFPGIPNPRAAVEKYDRSHSNSIIKPSNPSQEEPADKATGVCWGWNGSLSGPGLYTTAGMEEIVIPGDDNRAIYNYLGHGASAGSGGSASTYFGVLVNVDSPDEYQGLTSSAGVTVSALGYGITAGYFWNGLGTPFDIGSPKGYFLGYAPGAQLSIWQSSVLYMETWRYHYEQ